MAIVCAASLGIGRSALASCGDYLMPLNPAHAGSSHLQAAGTGDLATSLWRWRPESAPCHGPGCGDAPGGSTDFIVLPERDRTGSSVALADRPGTLGISPWPTGRCAIGSDLPRPAVADDLLRPPRLG